MSTSFHHQTDFECSKLKSDRDGDVARREGEGEGEGEGGGRREGGKEEQRSCLCVFCMATITLLLHEWQGC